MTDTDVTKLPEPCPMCGITLTAADGGWTWTHPVDGCFMAQVHVARHDVATWNRRAQAGRTEAVGVTTEMVAAALDSYCAEELAKENLHDVMHRCLTAALAQPAALAQAWHERNDEACRSDSRLGLGAGGTASA